jgi:hypothetical protein
MRALFGPAAAIWQAEAAAAKAREPQKKMGSPTRRR